MKSGYARYIVILMLFLISVLFFSLSMNALAQPIDNGNGDGAGDFSWQFYMCSFIIIFLPIVLWILIAAWVSSDGKGRGMENPRLWAILAIFFGVIILIIYLIIRPRGRKFRCPNCRKKRFIFLMPCPFCHWSGIEEPLEEIPEGRCPNCGSPIPDSAVVCPSCYGNL